MKKGNITILLLSLMIVLASCKKGDTGDTGPAGASGSNGTNGVNGLNGNANVSTITFNVGPTGWQSNGAQTYVYNNVLVPQITQALIDSGLIIAYWDRIVDQIQLPFVDGNVNKSYYAEISLGHYQFEIDYFGQSLGIPANPYKIKLVLATAHARMSNPELNWNDYEAVKTRFNLKD